MNYVISERYKQIRRYSSKGCQIKYVRNNYWYKLDSNYNEGGNEHLASLVLRCSSINNYVYYERCTVNNKKACRSKSFLYQEEVFIPLSTIVCDVYNVSSSEDFLWSHPNIGERIYLIEKAVKYYTNNEINLYKWISTVLYLDMLIINRDRHLDNLGIIKNILKNTYRVAPIFDNGQSFLCDDIESVRHLGIEEAINSQHAKTVSGSFIQQALACTENKWDSPFKVNFKALNNMIQKDNTITKLQKEVLNYQYKNIGKIFM